MTAWAIGDVQGCGSELNQLLNKLCLSSDDRVYFVGDLINRGPDNVGTLQLIRSLANARVVLGNHDLHFLAVAAGLKKPGKKDTIGDLLAHPTLDDTINWLRTRPLVIHEPLNNRLFSHAGLPHIWSPTDASRYAHEVEAVLASDDYLSLLANMYGNEPARWHDTLSGWERLRAIINYTTRMRFISVNGALELTHKRDIAPDDFSPWFAHTRPDDLHVLFGHWEALDGNTGQSQFIALDTGCVWGRRLTAHNLDDGTRVAVQAGS